MSFFSRITGLFSSSAPGDATSGGGREGGFGEGKGEFFGNFILGEVKC